jgi:hypothetical protein
MRCFISLVTVAVLMVVMLLPAGATSAQQQFDAIVVEVGPTAKLLDDGQAVQVNVKVKCEPPAEVLEALVTVRQDAGTAFGEAEIPSTVCDGKKRTHRVRVEALHSTFRPGEAFMSTAVSVCLDAECMATALIAKGVEGELQNP